MSQFNVKLFRGNNYPVLRRKSVLVGDSLGYDLTIKQGKFISPKNTTSVEGLGPCIQVLLWSPLQIFNSHSAPELEKLGQVGKKVVENAVKLRDDIKNKTGEIIAFITGGMQYDPKVPISNESSKFLNEIYDALQEEGIETIVIAGQKKDGLNKRINTYARENSVTCVGGPIKELPKIGKNADNKEIQEILEEYFDFVELPPSAKIEVIDELPPKTQCKLH